MIVSKGRKASWNHLMEAVSLQLVDVLAGVEGSARGGRARVQVLQQSPIQWAECQDGQRPGGGGELRGQAGRSEEHDGGMIGEKKFMPAMTVAEEGWR